MEYIILSGLASKSVGVVNPIDGDTSQVCSGNNIEPISMAFKNKNKQMEQVFTNARLVLADEVIRGSVKVLNGVIADVSSGVSLSSSSAIDCDNNYLLPGLVELHTDQLETHYMPRPNVRWDMLASIQAHDAQVAAAGITTVYDCLRCGQESDKGSYEQGEMLRLAEQIHLAEKHNRLRVEHRLHLRCEVSAADALDDFHQFDHMPEVGLVSMMDHAPGQRQFVTPESYAEYHQKRLKMSDEEFSDYVDKRVSDSKKYSDTHRQAISELCRERNIPMASHDDATLAHVQESIDYGVGIAEFPTTVDAALKSHAAGLGVLMGAPNVVRGGSHSGNVAAVSLVEKQCLDILSSDYIPSSLMQAVFMLSTELGLLSLSDAVALVSKNPASKMKLKDRGSIEEGLRADLVQVVHDSELGCTPFVKSVWRDGQRVL